VKLYNETDSSSLYVNTNNAAAYDLIKSVWYWAFLNASIEHLEFIQTTSHSTNQVFKDHAIAVYRVKLYVLLYLH